MAKKKKAKKRKKPPGAKKPSVPMANPTFKITMTEFDFGDWDSFAPDASHPFARMMNSKEICLVHPNYDLEIMRVIQTFLDNNLFDPPLDDDYSIYLGGNMMGFDAEETVGQDTIISAFGLDDLVISMIQKHLKQHDKADTWCLIIDLMD